MTTITKPLTNATIESTLNGLKKLSDLTGTPRLMFAIAKNRGELENALRPFAEVRNQIIMEKSGGTGTLDPKENPDDFRAAIDAINIVAREEINVQVTMVPLSELGENDISLEAMLTLEFMLEEE